jgi:hypothetical protein
MAGTRKRAPTIKLVLKWIKQGYGQGTGKDYKPFLYVRDVPSEGSSNMVRRRVSGRVHHYLSTLEFLVHLLAEHCGRVIDIREQYALLPWTETQDFAAKLGIDHPLYPDTTVPIVMTTDLVVSLQEPDGIRHVAISVKPENKLDERTMEKLLLERLYWNQRGVTWLLVTEKDIPQPRANNLQFFEMALQGISRAVPGVGYEEFARHFESGWSASATLLELINLACQCWGISSNDGQLLLGQAVWQRVSRIDLDAATLSHTAPIALLGEACPRV